MEEIWKETDIEGYYISNMGNLRGRSGKIVKLNTTPKGYKCYASYPEGRNGSCKCLRIHRLVAEAFIPNPDNKPQVNHIDGDKSNNKVTNLEWCANQENTIHAYRTGLAKPLKGCDNASSKLTKEDILYIRSHYKYHDREFSTIALGKKFNVSRYTIASIVKYKTYKEE